MKTIIVDLDGTLALNKHREHYLKGSKKDWVAYFEASKDDKPNKKIINLVNLLKSSGYRIHIFSARADIVRQDTINWLSRNCVSFDHITMREINSFTPDEELKKKWLFDFYPDYLDEVEFILDDRNKVVSMWRSLGLTCLQVADGNF